MISSTNNKVIHINMKSALANDSSLVFDAMQLEAIEGITIINCNSELQKSYMKLLSNRSKNK